MRKNKQQQQDQSDASSEQQNEQSQAGAGRKPKVDRLDKIKNFKNIIINLSMTQYPVISEVAQNLNWIIQTTNDAGDWDVFWIDMSIDPDVLIKMHLFQKISHYPGIHIIARKNLLGLNLMSLRTKMPQQFDFFPLTWMLPLQYAEFRSYFQSKPKGKARTYIVKPEADCQGRGIFLTRRLQDLQNGKHYVVQRYLARPYLIQDLKFDLRIYVLLCGTNPLRLYIYNEGLARLATQKYAEPNRHNLQKQYIHLTNYAINKNNPKFVFNNNSNNMGVGHKRSVSSVFNLLAERGVDIEELKRKIDDVAIKTIICGLPLMSHQYKFSQPEDYSGNMCFHILGLDIMLNNKAEPVLLQVNHTPSFTTDTPLDHSIKSKLIHDTLMLMNINTKTKFEGYNRAKDISKERLYNGKRSIFEGKEREVAIEQAQKLRDLYQDKHLGGFRRIFPLKDQEQMKKYNFIIQTANKTYVEDSGSIRLKQLERQSKKMKQSQLKLGLKHSSLKQAQQQKDRQQIQPQKTIIKADDSLNNKYIHYMSNNKSKVEQDCEEQSELVIIQGQIFHQNSQKQRQRLTMGSNGSLTKKYGLKHAMQNNQQKLFRLFRENQFQSIQIPRNPQEQNKTSKQPKQLQTYNNCKTSNNAIEQPHSAIISITKLHNKSQTKTAQRIKSNSTAKSQLKRTKEVYQELPLISDTIFTNRSTINNRQNPTPNTPQRPPMSIYSEQPYKEQDSSPQKPQKAQKAQIKIYDQIAMNIQEMIQKKTKGQYVMPKIVHLNVNKQRIDKNHNLKKNLYL